MYAIFQDGGKQYKVNEGQIIRLEKSKVSAGENIEFTKVLMIVNNEEIKIGTPFIKDSIIRASIITHNRNKKLKIIKFRRRKHYRKQQGHRQWFSEVRITDIGIPT